MAKIALGVDSENKTALLEQRSACQDLENGLNIGQCDILVPSLTDDPTEKYATKQ